MIEVLSVSNMRQSDAHTIANYIPSKELMYNAGKGVYDVIDWQPPVAIVCGSGNNAGDGYVIADLLHDADIEVDIILLSEKFSMDGKYYYDKCMQKKIPSYMYADIDGFDRYNTIVDCIFGTGFKGDVLGTSKDVIEAINNSSSYVVSVDINSGLNGDNGMAKLAVISDMTVSVGGYKSGHYLNMAKDVMKNKCNVDINIRPIMKPYYLLEYKDISKVLPSRPNFSNKGTYGYTALIGGSFRYSGAIRLANYANAAMRSGAGVVKVASSRSICKEIMPTILESTLFPLSSRDDDIIFVKEEIDELMRGVKSIAFGMGISVDEEVKKMLIYILEHYKGRLIIDASGLEILSTIDADIIDNATCKVILTPHVKEFARLLHTDIDTVLDDPITLAIDYAKAHNVIVLLKGPTTIVTDGDMTYLSDTGCAGMATAGSGDVLSGILSAICSYNDDLALATAGGAYINGKAGEYAQGLSNPISMIASDTISCIPNVITDLI